MNRSSVNKSKYFNNSLELIGNTPMVKLSKLDIANNSSLFLKLEYFSPGGSIKDRIALSMIEDAEKKGLLNSESTIIEPTSGNTGIGIAMISAIKGYKCIIIMPESMSLERIYILKSYGAQVILTPSHKGMQGCIDKADELTNSIKNSIILKQFNNLANPQIHRETTAKEILASITEPIDVFSGCWNRWDFNWSWRGLKRV